MALADIISLIKLGSSSSQTTTSGKTLTADQVQALLKKTLEGTQGLASITGGEKAAGLYNSTVATQLTNDLVSSAAAEAAAQSTASTSTTTTPATVNPMKAGLAMGGAQLLSSMFNPADAKNPEGPSQFMAGYDKVKGLMGSLMGASEEDSIDFLAEQAATQTPITDLINFQAANDFAVSQQGIDSLLGSGYDVFSELGSYLSPTTSGTSWF